MAYTNATSQYYEQLVRRRQSGVADEMLPATHIVNWDDAPSKLTVLSNAVRVPLCSKVNSPPLDEWIGCKDRKAVVSLPRATLDVVSDLLLLGSGILGRSTSINWNPATPISAHNIYVPYFRGPASGGGLYPTELYLVANNIEGVPAGVYHYDGAHHALGRLHVGSHRHAVRQACNHPSADSADFLLIITARFWKNLFKYYNFAFQVVTHDAGCLADCIQQVAWRSGLETTTLYWFKDSLLVDLLGLACDQEAVCAVITARGHQAHTSGPKPLNQDPDRPLASPNISRIRNERSQSVFFPQLLRDVHRATLVEGDRRPESDLLPEWEGRIDQTHSRVDLPLGCTLPSGFTNALVRRETSFGRFRRDPPLLQEDLAQLFCFVSCSARHSTDIYASPRGPSAVRLCLISRHVSGVPAGTYDYDPRQQRLIQTNHGAVDCQLQDLYFLDNYNLDQIAAILVVVGRLKCVETAWGSRGLRMMNAESGMVAQRCYLVASALDFGCGAALGFDATQMNRLVDVDGESESSILLIFLGHQVPSAYAYDFRLY